MGNWGARGGRGYCYQRSAGSAVGSFLYLFPRQMKWFELVPGQFDVVAKLGEPFEKMIRQPVRSLHFFFHKKSVTPFSVKEPDPLFKAYWKAFRHLENADQKSTLVSHLQHVRHLDVAIVSADGFAEDWTPFDDVLVHGLLIGFPEG